MKKSLFRLFISILLSSCAMPSSSLYQNPTQKPEKVQILGSDQQSIIDVESH